MSKISCVMFDFGNVFGIFNTPRFHSFILEHRGNCSDPRDLFSNPWQGTMKDFDLGKISESDYFDIIQRQFQLRDVSCEDFYGLLGEIIWMDRDMIFVRDELRKRGIATVLITNMNPFHLRYLRKNYPELMNGFEVKMISCEEGIVKPDPEAWIRPLDFLGLRAEECIFVDDAISNVEAACRLGVKGWYYNVTDQFFCSNGRLDEMRLKFTNFLSLLDSLGILEPRM